MTESEGQLFEEEQVIYDDDGRPAYRFTRNIFWFDEIKPSQFQGIDRPDPIPGTKIPRWLYHRIQGRLRDADFLGQPKDAA